jgi:hypothetical protein
MGHDLPQGCLVIATSQMRLSSLQHLHKDRDMFVALGVNPVLSLTKSASCPQGQQRECIRKVSTLS